MMKSFTMARLLPADFKKGFDLIDDRILLRKLSGFGLHLALVKWVAACLQGKP